MLVFVGQGVVVLALGVTVAIAATVPVGCSAGSPNPPTATDPSTTTAVTLPYVLEAIVYQPPFNKSAIMYRGGSTLGTRTRWEATDPLGAILHVNVVGRPPIDPRTVVSETADGAIVTDMSGLGVTLNDAPTCEAEGSGCDPNANDPDHQADSFSILFGVGGHFVQSGDLATYTFDLSTGTPATLSARELYGLAQDVPDYSAFCTDSGCDTASEHLAEQYFTSPQDARQLLAMDPYALVVKLDEHPARFAPGCSSPGDCTTPARLTVAESPVGSQMPIIAGVPQAHVARSNAVTAEDPIARQTVVVASEVANPDLGAVRISFLDVTASEGFNQRVATLIFENTSHCERGDIDLWFDKAFGSFLWNPHLANVCTI